MLDVSRQRGRVVSASDLREAEAALRYAPENGAVVGRSLMWVRDREAYRLGGFSSWEAYVEEALGVPAALAEASIDAYVEWERASLVAWRESTEWLRRTVAAAGPVENLREPDLRAARDACLPGKEAPPEVWPEVAAACGALETVLEEDDDDVQTLHVQREGVF